MMIGIGQEIMVDPRHLPQSHAAVRFLNQIFKITDFEFDTPTVTITAENRTTSLSLPAPLFMGVEPAQHYPGSLVGRKVTLNPFVAPKGDEVPGKIGIVGSDNLAKIHEADRTIDIRNGPMSVSVDRLLLIRSLDERTVRDATYRVKQYLAMQALRL